MINTERDASTNIAPCAKEATTSKPTASGLLATSTLTPPCAAILIESSEKIAAAGLTAEPNTVLFRYELTYNSQPNILPRKKLAILIFYL